MLADPLDVDLGSLDCLLYLLAVAQVLVCCKAFQLQTQNTTGIIQAATSRFRHFPCHLRVHQETLKQLKCETLLKI